MKVNISFPLFLIVSGDNAVISEAEGNECFLIYRNRELAELYLEQVGPGYQAEQVSAAEILQLISAVPNVIYFALDNVVSPQTFKMLAASDVADVASDSLE